jgi:hypothetical protein
VPRCLLPGRPTADCLFCDVNGDGTSALKVWNLNPCGAVLGAFNVQASKPGRLCSSSRGMWWQGSQCAKQAVTATVKALILADPALLDKPAFCSSACQASHFK